MNPSVLSVGIVDWNHCTRPRSSTPELELLLLTQPLFSTPHEEHLPTLVPTLLGESPLLSLLP